MAVTDQRRACEYRAHAADLRKRAHDIGSVSLKNGLLKLAEQLEGLADDLERGEQCRISCAAKNPHEH
jgi:hypothetical protein